MSFPKRGEVYLVSLDPTIGAEIGKSRPALVISNDSNNEFADTVTVLPITSKIVKVYPFEVLLAKGTAGLPEDSKVKCNQIRTIDKIRLIKQIGHLDAVSLKEVEKAILIHIGVKLEIMNEKQ
ncbi:MAG: type II toxin-antitoxin system PemK/MazF family toxin [Caldiserica bacterium]|nr:type II toxin-antitoxin system PemK/MazF family toxin [Caldisericota bacterium]